MPGRSAPRRLRPAPVQPGTRYRVRITVPRLGSRRAWEATRSDFEQRLTTAESPAVIGAEVESETRRGRDYVRVSITAAVYAADVAEALTAAWDAFRQAAGDDAAGWDMAAASAEIQPEAQLHVSREAPGVLGSATSRRAGSRSVPVPAKMLCDPVCLRTTGDL
jgi:hypothetical protein